MNRLWAAEAVTGGGGAIEPLRAPEREDCPPPALLLGLPGSLKKFADLLPFGVCLPGGDT